MSKLQLLMNCLLACSSVFGLASSSLVHSQELEIYMRDGSTFKSPAQSDGIVWKTVRGPQQSQEQRFLWSQISELSLVEYPVAEQTRMILQWIQQLGSPSYAEREAAEQKLANPDVVGPFHKLIVEHAAATADLEIRYRLLRIADQIADARDVVGGRFDTLKLRNGTQFIGEAADFFLMGTLLDDPVRLDRNRVARIGLAEPPTVDPTVDPTVESTVVPTVVPTIPLSVHTYNQHGNVFYQGDEVVVSFESDQDANSLSIGQNINQQFVDQGLLMETESEGHIQLIKYPFRFCPIEAGERAACSYDERTGDRLRLPTRIMFCPPGQPSIVGGVKKFGIFLERVEHSRDFVVEAYNARGQMLGMVEASDQLCVFAGFQSNEPITTIRISQNEHLLVDRRLDETYAFDCITFDTPTPMAARIRPGINSVVTAIVQLADFGSLAVEQLSLSDRQISLLSPLTQRKRELSWAQVAAIGFKSGPDISQFAADDWRVQLRDGSIVKTERSQPTAAYDFVGHEFSIDQLVGLWKGTCRMPEASDFESGKPILVFPGCRIITSNFEWNDSGFRWNRPQSEALLQSVKIVNSPQQNLTETDDPDPIPLVDQIDFSKPGLVPTLWLAQPKRPPFDQHYLLLDDGQYFVLGGQSGFQVGNISARSIQIVLHGKSKIYPISRVVSFAPPESFKSEQ